MDDSAERSESESDMPGALAPGFLLFIGSLV